MKTKLFPASDFGLQSKAEFEGFEERHALCRPVDHSHVFDRLQLTAMNIWRDSLQPMWISGPTGSGKTTLIQQYTGRLNIPLVELTGSPTAEKSYWIGYEKISQGNNVWHDGRIAAAYRHGHWLCINEVDLVPGCILASMNDIFERGPLTIEETGEVLWPHENFRVVVTANTAGMGDITGSFQGRNQQDQSFLDRFWAMRIDYMSREQEIPLVKAILVDTFSDDISNAISGRLRNIAEKVRAAYTGAASDARVAMTMSTRTLLRVASIIASVPDAQEHMGIKAYDLALELSFTNKLKDAEPESYAAIHAYAQAEFGDSL